MALPLAAVAAAGCGGGKGGAAGGRTAACAQPPGDAAYYAAAQEYLKGLAPAPRRFLNPVGTDSALPDGAFRALQDKGPSYLFPTEPGARRKLLARLDSVGPWAGLLVTWHGVERRGDSVAVIRLGGHYIVGEGRGQAAPRRALHFACDTAWHYSRTEEERSS
jgi:hypothetical protein